MTKAALVDLICERIGFSKKDSSDVVELVFAIIKESLRHGEKVKISGFGSFIVINKRERLGRNPQTGKPITICSRRTLSFRPSHVLRGQVNQGAGRSP